ncbi:MAG: metallophosphoesterase [Planctomycetia bacterium]
MTGLFFSDLHLFSRRSIGQQRWEQNRSLIASANSVVLGGDIFDFRWSRYGSLDATLNAASDWLESAIAMNPAASWIYLLGNHDCHPRMQSLLSSFRDRYPRFDWSETVWKIGSSVFLHGDILDGLNNQRGIESYRKGFHDGEPQGQLGNLLYSAVIRARLHTIVPRLRYTRRQTCIRLLRYLESIDTGLHSDVRNIYFGHTHVPMHNYRFDRFRFHNPGSGIRYQNLSPATFKVT